MLNQAIEDAAAFGEFRDALTRRNPNVIEPQRITGENRKQRRERERAERKAAQKAKVKA